MRVRYQEVSYAAASKILEQVQLYLSQLVKAMDDDALVLFQKCMGHIFKRAGECLQQRVEMEIPDYFEDEPEDLS